MVSGQWRLTDGHSVHSTLIDYLINGRISSQPERPSISQHRRDRPDAAVDRNHVTPFKSDLRGTQRCAASALQRGSDRGLDAPREVLSRFSEYTH